MSALDESEATEPAEEAPAAEEALTKPDAPAAEEAPALKPGHVFTRTGDGPTPIDFLFQAPGAGADVSPKERAFLRKLDAFFDAHGLRPISKRMAFQYVTMMANDTQTGAGTFDRVQPWLLNQLNGVRRVPGMSPWQKGCPALIPGLASSAFWDTSPSGRLGGWVSALEAAAPLIRDELLSLRGTTGFQPYRAPATSHEGSQAADGVGSVSHDKGEWSVFYLFLHNLEFTQNRLRCPETCKAIDLVKQQYHHAFFSALAPSTHVTKHCGPTNKKLRCHLPLIVPPGDACRIRVGDETRVVEEFKCIVFDDSWEHEAWNESDGTRVVLIMDVWHPDLSPKEVKFLAFLQNAALKAEKELVTARDSEALENRIYDNFFSVIGEVKRRGLSSETSF